MEQETSPFGEKLLDATCKAIITPQPESEALTEIWSEGLLLKPKQGGSVFLPFTETQTLEPANYRLRITTSSSEITLSTFGSKFDPFAQKLVDAWGDALERALLMHEPVTICEFPAAYNRSAGEQSSGNCRARVYQTSLVVLPTNNAPIRVPYSSISSVTLQNYRVKVASSEEGTIEFSKLGDKTEFFADKLIEGQRNLEAHSIETIKGMLPSASYDELRGLSVLMSEGKAATRKDLQKISPNVWMDLEARAMDSPLGETYKYLSSIGVSDYTSIGLRRAMDRTHVWFLVLLQGSADQGGNCWVMEVTSETGHATYLFRVMSRGVFPTVRSEVFLGEAENTMQATNKAMIATGFRREPIYLSEDKLKTEAYSKYLYAAKNLDALRLLRERFFARIIHTSFQTWQDDLSEVLLFNTQSTDDQARWGKSQLDPADDSSIIPTPQPN